MFNELKKAWARRQLQSQIKRIIDTAEGHEQAGLPIAHEYYKNLANEADTAIAKYAATWDEKPESIRIQAPALRKVHLLAYGTSESITDKAGKVVGTFTIGAMLASVILTVFWAVNHDIFLMLTHWANVRWAH